MLISSDKLFPEIILQKKMEAENKQDLNSQLTLLLLYLNSWEEKEFNQPPRRASKGYDFDSLNGLEEKEYIAHSKTAKSVYLTEEGVAKAKELLARLKHIL